MRQSTLVRMVILTALLVISFAANTQAQETASGNATLTLILSAPCPAPPLPSDTKSGSHGLSATPRMLGTAFPTTYANLAPNASGPNLALDPLAVAGASSYWPYPQPFGPGGAEVWLSMPLT